VLSYDVEMHEIRETVYGTHGTVFALYEYKYSTSTSTYPDNSTRRVRYVPSFVLS
jgi:hypothetical protein